MDIFSKVFGDNDVVPPDSNPSYIESASSSAPTGSDRVPPALPTPIGMPGTLGPRGREKANQEPSVHVPFVVDIFSQLLGDNDVVPPPPAPHPAKRLKNAIC